MKKIKNKEIAEIKTKIQNGDVNTALVSTDNNAFRAFEPFLSKKFSGKCFIRSKDNFLVVPYSIEVETNKPLNIRHGINGPLLEDTRGLKNLWKYIYKIEKNKRQK